MWQLENYSDESDGRDFFAASDAISIVPHDSISGQSCADHNAGNAGRRAPTQTPKAEQLGSKGCSQKSRGVQIEEQTHVSEQVQDEMQFSSFAMSDAIVSIPQSLPRGEVVKVREDAGIPSQQSHHQIRAQNQSAQESNMVKQAEYLQVNVAKIVDRAEEQVMERPMQGLDSVCQIQMVPDEAVEWGQCDMTLEDAQALGSQAQGQSVLGSSTNQSKLNTMQQTPPAKGNASLSPVEMDPATQQ
jgi:hypothetical protein